MKYIFLGKQHRVNKIYILLSLKNKMFKIILNILFLSNYDRQGTFFTGHGIQQSTHRFVYCVNTLKIKQ